MNGEDGMAAGRHRVESIVSHGSVAFSFEQAIQCLLFILASDHGGALDEDFTI
jgi:hypothetical protein